jgi:O-antigen/teichoic acid export membrane protein
MASTTIVFGLLLIVLGLGGYVASGSDSVTALIPAFFGIALLVLGFLARAEQMRKHAMHAAAAVGLVGLIGALMSLLRAPMETRSPLANASQIAMVVLMAVFVLLCVKSFREARRRRAG